MEKGTSILRYDPLSDRLTGFRFLQANVDSKTKAKPALPF
jgi:hypothetical protein